MSFASPLVVRSANHRRSGFTLIELLVVIGIIAVLMSLLFPAFRSARYSSQKIKCASNIRQVAMAMIGYANANKGCWPLKGPVYGVPGVYDADTNPHTYFWNETTLLAPLREYGADMNVLTCPSSELIFNPPQQWVSAPMVNGRMGVHYAYLARFGDPTTLGCGGWYESPPSAAVPKIKNGKGVILADLNIYFADKDNGLIVGYTGPDVMWLFSNHAPNNRVDLPLEDCRKFVRGSNRCYADGSVEWALPHMMGAYDKDMSLGTLTHNARYDDNGGFPKVDGSTPVAPNGRRLQFW
jgi:prepilin-type N-terminal cleavage/methylation domain-containing protein